MIQIIGKADTLTVNCTLSTVNSNYKKELDYVLNR